VFEVFSSVSSASAPDSTLKLGHDCLFSDHCLLSAVISPSYSTVQLLQLEPLRLMS